MSESSKPMTVIIPTIALAFLLAMVLLSGWDHSLFIASNKLAQVLPDSFWQILTTLAAPLVAPLLVFTLFHKQPLFLRTLLIGVGLAIVCNYGLKYGFAYPRPASVLAAGDFFHTVPIINSPSFPSGHTITIFSLMSLISHWINNTRLTILLFVVAFVISLSRIAVGAHWPSDVLFGALVGWIIGWAAVMIQCRLGDTIHPKLVLGIYFVGLFVGIFALVTKTPYPAGQWLSTAIALFTIAYSLRSITELLHRQKG